jgi:hypothetical protein
MESPDDLRGRPQEARHLTDGSRLVGHRSASRVAHVVTIVAAGLAVAIGLAADDALGVDGLTIDVDSAQNVTIVGASDSLRSTIADLCARAGVRLLAYEAEDRPFSASYQQLPLAEALARLLRAEIFLVGLRPRDDGGGDLVTWLRVSGAKGGVGGPLFAAGTTQAGPSPSAAAAIDLGIAANVIETALTSDDTIARNNARRTILENLRGNPAPLQRYLEQDTVVLVDQLAGFPHAAEFLNSLQSVGGDVKQRSQIQTILRGIRARQDAARREAATSARRSAD